MRFVFGLIDASVRYRVMVLVAVAGFAVLGAWAFRTMSFDAFPDLTNVQVQVLTASPGMGATEVEELVTVPIERALGGLPHLDELRSLSRSGISAITVVFEDGTDPWLARQWVKERVDVARGDIPAAAGTPELAPPTTGLGEVYQFTVSADDLPMPELYRVFQRDIAPRLLAVDGVVEVNAWGGGEPELHARVDPFALAARGLTQRDVHEALERALGRRAGGAAIAHGEQTVVRGLANPIAPDELTEVLLRGGEGEDPPGGMVRLGDVATVSRGGALTVGFGSGDGEGEMLFVMVQLLMDGDARQVVTDVRARLDEIGDALPEGVWVTPIYDRERLIASTLDTVASSLLEGGLLVVLILLLFLGDLRAGLLVASVIPLAMLGAFLGLRVLGHSGNLMSLGAIDFGLVVDGTVVVTESIVALTVARAGAFGAQVAERARHVARPVLFAASVLLLVYVPVLLMSGTEGKLFRPMALTVLCAVGTALILSFTYVPALASLVIRPHGERHTWLHRLLSRAYEPVLGVARRRPWGAATLALAVVIGSGFVGSRLGVEFVPRLEEGDIVIQTERLPSLSPAEALRETTRLERAIADVPEVVRVASRTGSPAVATDPMGIEETDILVGVAPRSTWRAGLDREGLIDELERRILARAPGAQLTFTQPIEMRFNELLEGITSDVGVEIYGTELDQLIALGGEVAAELEAIEGAADVVAPQVEGVPRLDVVVDPRGLAAFGVPAAAVLAVVADVQRGTAVGTVTQGQFQDRVVVKLDLTDELPLSSVPVGHADGHAVPLGALAALEHHSAPATVSRAQGSRRVLVTANVRGRDVGSFVREARERVSHLALPPGYWIGWSGTFEQLDAASDRVAIMAPIVLLLVFGLLYLALSSWRVALLIFSNVPVAVSGGVWILAARDMNLSMSAIVGFIALFGIAVMNGIVLLARIRELNADRGAAAAALAGARERFRPVIMTAAIAGIGFTPMAFATGMGAEVQRPLATVVIGGLITSTFLTLVVLPSLYALVFSREDDPIDDAATSV